MAAGQRGRRNARICDNNHMTIASVTAPAAVGFPFSNAINAKRRGKVWKPGTNSFTIEIDLLTAKQFSFVGIFGESNQVFKISNAATITIKANSINIFSGAVPYSKTIPVTDSGAFADLTDASNLTGFQYRFVQIIIDDSTNPDDVEIAYIYLGDHTDFAFNVNQGFQWNQQDLSKRVSSDSGVVYSVAKNQYSVFSGMGFSYLDTSDRQKIQSTVARLGLSNPFVFCLDPLEIGFDLEDGTKLCYFEQLPQLTHVYMTKFNVAFSLREVV
jgi:hypothetical protein